MAESFRFYVAILCFYELNHNKYWISLHLRLQRGAPRNLGFLWQALKLLGFIQYLGNCKCGTSQEKTNISQWFLEMPYFEVFLLVGAKAQNCHIISEGLSYIYIYVHIYTCIHIHIDCSVIIRTKFTLSISYYLVHVFISFLLIFNSCFFLQGERGFWEEGSQNKCLKKTHFIS